MYPHKFLLEGLTISCGTTTCLQEAPAASCDEK